MEKSELVGFQLSLLIMGEEEDADEHWPVLTGMVREEGERLVLARPEGNVPIRDEWIPRVQPVDPRVKRVLLGADFVLPMRVGDLPASATPKQLHDLGLRPDRRRTP